MPYGRGKRSARIILFLCVYLLHHEALDNIADLDVYLLDPMLATGGSGIDAVASLYKHGVKKIHFLCIIAAPEGVETFHKKYPEVPLYIGALDRQLNENCYICPGLGDAGDRIFGTLQ